MTTVNFYVDSVGINPSLNGLGNVIKRVTWYAVFELDGEKSVVPGEAFLPDPQPESFVPIESVSDQQVLDWSIASHGGDAFLNELTAHQTTQLEYKKLRKSFVRWTTPLLDPKPWDATHANQIPTVVI